MASPPTSTSTHTTLGHSTSTRKSRLGQGMNQSLPSTVGRSSLTTIRRCTSPIPGPSALWKEVTLRCLPQMGHMAFGVTVANLSIPGWLFNTFSTFWPSFRPFFRPFLDLCMYSYHLNDVKCGARCFVTRSDGEGKHARRGAQIVALSRTLGFTNQLDTVY